MRTSFVFIFLVILFHSWLFTSKSWSEHRSISALKSGQWFKLICGASNQEVVSIRNLCYLFSAAGADCIDIAADSAVIIAADEGISASVKDFGVTRPFLMISINDGEDDHFRKAYFNATTCPPNCPRPCERHCPAQAIDTSGVIEDRCYGCGRCIKVCPYDLITEQGRQLSLSTLRAQFSSSDSVFSKVDAVEVHTNQSHELKFYDLMKEVGDVMFPKLKALAISFPDFGESETSLYLEQLQRTLEAHPAWNTFSGVQIWQSDGNPMSGDILRIPSYRSMSLARRLLLPNSELKSIDFSSSKHFVQLSGGINEVSMLAAKESGLTNLKGFGGYGVGGFVRKSFLEEFRKLSGDNQESKIEKLKEFPEMLIRAKELVQLAKS